MFYHKLFVWIPSGGSWKM